MRGRKQTLVEENSLVDTNGNNLCYYFGKRRLVIIKQTTPIVTIDWLLSICHLVLPIVVVVPSIRNQVLFTFYLNKSFYIFKKLIIQKFIKNNCVITYSFTTCRTCFDCYLFFFLCIIRITYFVEKQVLPQLKDKES